MINRNIFKKNFVYILIIIVFIQVIISHLTFAEDFKYKNNLKTLLRSNKATIYALIVRTFNARDYNNNDLIEPSKNETTGNFINAIDRLDELKDLGINTIHLLPIFPVGKKKALGIAGSTYAASSFTSLNPELDSPDNNLNVSEEAKKFIDACHQRNIKVMVDIPCCGSVDLAEQKPELFLLDKNNQPIIPCNWTDVRLFNPYKLANHKELNPELLSMHMDMIDFLIDLNVDGIRIDVARTKPALFWKEIITYARKKDPEFAFLAESFGNEQISSISNIPPDNASELLSAGFDAYYHQYSRLKDIKSVTDFTNLIKNNLLITNQLNTRRSSIASFTTHDEKSPYIIGGEAFYKLIIVLGATLPNINPYFVSGMETGDKYNYSFANKKCPYSNTDNNVCFVHPGRIDIFNYSRRPEGDLIYLKKYIKNFLRLRNNFSNVFTMGDFNFIKPINLKSDKIIAYTRNYDNKSFFVVANLDSKNENYGQFYLPQNFTKGNILEVVIESEKLFSPCIKNKTISVFLAPKEFKIYTNQRIIFNNEKENNDNIGKL